MGHQVVQRKEMIQGVLIERERERETRWWGVGGRKGKKGVILKLFRRKKNVFTHIHTHTLTFSDSSNKMGTWCF